MSKYRGPRIRMIRHLGDLPALTQKTTGRTSRPGQHGARRRKPTQFAYRLVEKQKLRLHYGVSEKQLVCCVKAARNAKGSTGQILLQILEIRLDNIIYRLGWAPTLPAARQLVSHGHILVDNERVKIPSFSCDPPKLIKLQDHVHTLKIVQQTLQEQMRILPTHLLIDIDKMTAVVNQTAVRNEIPLSLNELLIIEYYSNRLLLKVLLVLP